jgi:hypothetical protein
MVNVRNPTGLDEPADPLQRGAPNYHGGRDDEIDLNQGGEDAADWTVSSDCSAWRVPMTSVNASPLIHESRRTVGKDDLRVIEQGNLVLELCRRPSVITFEYGDQGAGRSSHRRHIGSSEPSNSFVFPTKDNNPRVVE